MKNKEIYDLINYLEDETQNYSVNIGVDGYNSLSTVEEYFDKYYRETYANKLITLIMLLMSWFDTTILFETDAQLDSQKYNNQIIDISNVKLIMNLINESMSDVESNIHFIFTDDDNQKFLLYIYGNTTIGFSNLSERTKKYVEKQLNLQGLSLWLDED